ncbi:MAG TPA: hypothetical protein VGN12_02760 [Pirellulales bacterium]|jgi:hypothetical protein
MKRSLADAAAWVRTAVSTCARLLRSCYLVAGVVIVAGITVQNLVEARRLMTPVDITGTLLGGGMTTSMDAAFWMVALAGAMLAALLRLPGFRLSWAAAGGLRACSSNWVSRLPVTAFAVQHGRYNTLTNIIR